MRVGVFVAEPADGVIDGVALSEVVTTCANLAPAAALASCASSKLSVLEQLHA